MRVIIKLISGIGIKKMKKNRNSLLELYRIFLCFWAMYAHDFFILERSEAFSVAQLTVDFFYIISGYFLISTMRKLKNVNPFIGAGKLMIGRIKPIFFSMVFATAFNAVCMLLFIRADFWDVLFTNFRYWWFLLYLVISIGIIYLIYRLINNEKAFAIFLIVLTIAMGVLHYQMEEKGFFIYVFTYVARTFGCLAVGMLCSYLPKWKPKVFNVNIVLVAVLFGVVFYLAYAEKEYWTRILMIGLFACLVYFTTNVNFSCKVLDVIGTMSTRMYVYFAFVSMLCVLGVTDCRLLFTINVFLSTMDLLLTQYYKKYKALKNATIA